MARGCSEAGDDSNVGLGRSPGVGLIVDEMEEAEFASLNVTLCCVLGCTTGNMLCAWMRQQANSP